MMNIKPLSLSISALLSGVLLTQCTTIPTSPAVKQSEEAQNTVSPFAEQFGYPYTRTFEEGKKRRDFAENGDTGSRDRQDNIGRTGDTQIRHLKRDDSIDKFYQDVWVDKYRWLENIDWIDPVHRKETSEDRKRNLSGSFFWEDPENERRLKHFSTVQHENSEINQWVDKQNEATLNYLNKIPYAQQVKQNIEDLLAVEYIDMKRDTEWGKIISLRDKEGFFMLKRENKDNTTTVLLDERNFSPDKGTTYLLQSRVFSPDNRYFAYVVSGGSADSDKAKRSYLYVIDTKTGQEATPRIDRIDGSNSDVSWKDNNSFYYVQKNTNGWRNILLRRLDKNEFQDSIIVSAQDLGWHSPKEMWEEDGQLIIISGWGGIEDLLFFKDLKTGKLYQAHSQSAVNRWKNNEAFIKNRAATFVQKNGDEVDIISTENSEWGELIRVNIKHPRSQRTVIIPAIEGKHLDEAVYQKGHYLLHYVQDGIGKILLSDDKGKMLRDLTPLPAGTGGSLYSYVASEGHKNNDDGTHDDSDQDYLSFRFSNAVTPLTTYKYSMKNDKFIDAKLRYPSPFNPEHYETYQDFAVSKDGTKVPYVVSHRKDIKLDGNNPTMLYAYGGFNVSSDAHQGFGSGAKTTWLEHGGVYVSAALRGGNEYGEAWHEAGRRQNKMNVFDDYIAVAEQLIAKGYTSKDKLAINGGSNGGLLVGAAMTLRPDLFRVALPEVGVLDMFRHADQRTGNWIDEYGIPQDGKAMYEHLKSYSPYHNIKDNVCYPSTMVMTSKRDDRVVPSHSYKFAARLQEKQACAKPTFLFTAEDQGHSTHSRIERRYNIFLKTLFSLNEMGIKELPPIPKHRTLTESKAMQPLPQSKKIAD